MSEFLKGFCDQIKAAPDALALTCRDKDYSRKDLLASAVGVTKVLPASVRRVGLLAESGPDWAAGLMACESLGLTIIPLPTFFSAEQLGYILQAAAIEHLLCSIDQVAFAQQFQIPFTVIGPPGTGSLDHSRSDRSQQIVFTSGSSGAPKGVVLEAGQLDHQARALAQAAAASPEDHHLSILPYPQLLEQICGLRIPLALGARLTVVPDAFAQVLQGDFIPLVQAILGRQPTTSVLVPEMLRGLVGTALAMKLPGFEGMRYVAVGGSHTPALLAEKAWQLGIPVHEGYGLTEACSVVAVNAYGKRKAGTVGQPLPGAGLRIVEGEIVVSGPSVMLGYMGGPVQEKQLKTADLGQLDDEGYLVVEGRRDNLLNSGMGRTLSPEWVESTLLNSPNIAQCGLVLDQQQRPAVVVTPAAHALAMTAEQWLTELRQFSAMLPPYAAPQSFSLVPQEQLPQLGLLTANGKWQRKQLSAYSAATSFQEIVQ